MAVRLLIVEDQPVVRSGLETLLKDAEMVAIEAAATVAEAIAMAAKSQADVVLLDVRLADGDGLAALARIKADRPELPVLIYTGHENPAYAARAVALGAAGYLLKGATKDELVSAIRRAADGESLWTDGELRRVTSALAAPRTKPDMEVPLTRREAQVLAHMVEGHTNQRIADELAVSYETVKEHVQNVLKKIGVNDRTQAAVWAVRSGLRI